MNEYFFSGKVFKMALGYFLMFLGWVMIISIGCGEEDKKLGENKKIFPFRNISEDELSNYIDSDYVISSNDIRLTKNTLPYYSNIDADSYDEIILILEHKEPIEGKYAKIKILDFDHIENKWGAINTTKLNKERVDNSFLITDINENGINEFHLQTFSIGINYFDFTPIVFELNNDKELVNLFLNSMPSEIGYVYDKESTGYYNVDFIWAEGETHWGCHYFQVMIYEFNGINYSFTEKRITPQKYGLDVTDSKIGGCEKYSVDKVLFDVGLKATN